jgi:hypothetical protein
MAFNSVEGLVTYTASAGQTDFGFAFKIYANTDVSVYVDGVKKTIVDDYSATVNGDNGGTITFNSGLAANAEVMLVRELPITRDTEYQLNGDLSSAALNRDQNYQTYLAMDVKVKAGLNLAEAKDYTDQETAERIVQDSLLQSNINSKEAESINRDSLLQTQIDSNLKFIGNVKSGYQAGDANLQEQLTGKVPLEASAFSPVSWHDQSIDNSVTIPDNKNAWSFGPTVTISVGQSVTIGDGSYWTIANGEQQ